MVSKMEKDRLDILSKVSQGIITPEDAEKALRVLDRDFLVTHEFHNADSWIYNIQEFVTPEFYIELEGLDKTTLTHSMIREMILKHVSPEYLSGLENLGYVDILLFG